MQKLEANSALPIDQIILDAAKEPGLRWRQKRRLEASVFFKGPLYDELASRIKHELYVDEVIDEDGQVQAAFDWASLIAKVLPILLEWLSGRFGARR